MDGDSKDGGAKDTPWCMYSDLEKVKADVYGLGEFPIENSQLDYQRSFTCSCSWLK